MTDFHTTRTIKALRKARQCDQCLKKIAIGEPAVMIVGKWEGDFYAGHQHPECHTAALAYAKQFDLWGDDWPWFHDMDMSDAGDWMKEHAPVVYERLGWKRRQEELDAEEAEEARELAAGGTP